MKKGVVYMRRLAVLYLFLLLMVILTGCWNRTELNEIGLISALGIDRGENGWIVSYQLINHSTISSNAAGGGMSGGAGAPVHVFSSEGPTLREAIDVSYTETPRRLFFPHADVLILGKEAASKGIRDIIDFYWRNPNLRENVNVLVTNGLASEMLKQLIPPERLPGSAIANISRQTAKFNNNYPSIKMFELTRSLVSESHAAGVPQIELVEEFSSNKVESMDQLNKTSTPTKLRITGLAAFQKDRWIGLLTQDESFGISWLTDKVQFSTLSFPCPGENEPGLLSYQTNAANTKVKLMKEGDEYTFKVSVDVKGRVTETSCPTDLSNLSNLHAAEKEIQEVIKQHMLQGWEACKRLHVDLPHFADYIHRKYPEEWSQMKERWETEGIPSTRLVLQVTASISQTGMSQKAFEPDEN
ncbi:Ger(x)C family spore germination protein [Paenibacillus campinasensis]|uniref:Ger(X)C family spore germination protein n=2 Tax=Paenibacillus TaxID=44249 RepID=A0ABW9T0L8_9BACL|nr:Ger(x)C family spore germination protein [Paenibacillus campinasensis]